MFQSDDGKALQNYSLYLWSCCNVMQELQIMEKLILPTNIKLIMSKLLSSEEKSGDLQNVTYWKGPAAEPDSVIS